jgi:hypothetical protein
VHLVVSVRPQLLAAMAVPVVGVALPPPQQAMAERAATAVRLVRVAQVARAALVPIP